MNSLAQILKTFEGTDKLKEFAPLINWGEKTTVDIGDYESFDSTNRDVLYKHLSEQSLIDLVHPRLVTSKYGYAEEIPYFYCFKSDLFEFLKAFINMSAEVYNTKLSVNTIERNFNDFIEFAYEHNMLGTEEKVKQCYDKITDFISFSVPYLDNFGRPVEDVVKNIEFRKSQSLYLLGIGSRVDIDDFMLCYAIKNLNIEHLQEESLPLLQKVLSNLKMYGDTHISYSADNVYFEEFLLKSAKEHIRLMANLDIAAKQLVIDERVESRALVDLGAGCPIIFDFIERHYPGHQYSVGGKKFYAGDIKNIYAIARKDVKETENPKHLKLGKTYPLRVEQYKRVGVMLQTMDDWQPTSFPDMDFSIFPGLPDLSDAAVREKLKLDIEISKTLNFGKVFKV